MTCGFQTVSSPHEVFCWLTVNCGVFNFNIIGFLSNGRRIGAWNMVGQISSRPLMFFWPPKGSVLEGKSPLFQGNQSWCDIIIWPEFFFQIVVCQIVYFHQNIIQLTKHHFQIFSETALICWSTFMLFYLKELQSTREQSQRTLGASFNPSMALQYLIL